MSRKGTDTPTCRKPKALHQKIIIQRKGTSVKLQISSPYNRKLHYNRNEYNYEVVQCALLLIVYTCAPAFLLLRIGRQTRRLIVQRTSRLT